MLLAAGGRGDTSLRLHLHEVGIVVTAKEKLARVVLKDREAFRANQHHCL